MLFAILSPAAIGLLLFLVALLIALSVAVNFYRGKSLEHHMENLEDRRENDSKIASTLEKRGRKLGAKFFHAAAAGSVGKMFEVLKDIRKAVQDEDDLDALLNKEFAVDFASRMADEAERTKILAEVAKWQTLDDARRQQIVAEELAKQAKNAPAPAAPLAPAPKPAS